MTRQASPVDGGPAFPSDPSPRSFMPSSSGMTLRDYFAAKAMQAGHGLNPCHLNAADRARVAYEVADAMLAARHATLTGETEA